MFRKYRRAYPILALGILVATAFAFALPVINLNVQNIGEGSAPVVSPADKGAVNFVLDSNNPDYVKGVTVSFDKNLTAGTIVYAKLYDSNGNLLTVGNTTLQSDLTAGSSVEVDFPQEVEIGSIENVGVVAKAPAVSP